MKKTKIQNIILYIINFILIGFIVISNKGIILNSDRIILKNMDESTQVSNLNKTIETLNNLHTEYANYIQTSKANLATAITNAGISTSSDATFETMITNVSNILSNKTNDATATAAQILSEKTAYVKGSKVTGTMANKGAVTASINAGESYTIPAGYHNGSGKVIANSLASQTQATATADNITAGKTAWVNGSLITGNGADNKAYMENGINGCKLLSYPMTATKKEDRGGYTWRFYFDVSSISNFGSKVYGEDFVITSSSYYNAVYEGHNDSQLWTWSPDQYQQNTITLYIINVLDE